MKIYTNVIVNMYLSESNIFNPYKITGIEEKTLNPKWEVLRLATKN